MATGTSSADPEMLDRFCRADEDIDNGLIRRAGLLGDALDRLAASGSAGLPDLAGWADRVRRNAAESLRLAAWVRQVAVAFRRADQGSVAAPPGDGQGLHALVDLLASLPHLATERALVGHLETYLAEGSIDADTIAAIATQLPPRPS